MRFCWCTDGPFDVRDFVVKQCFISNVGAFTNTRHMRINSHFFSIRRCRFPCLRGSGGTSLTYVRLWARCRRSLEPIRRRCVCRECRDSNDTLILGFFCLIQPTFPRRMSPNIEHQLRFLELGPFEGRQHSGIDVCTSATVSRLTQIPNFSSGLAKYCSNYHRARAKRCPSRPEHPNPTWTAMAVDGQVWSDPRAVLFDAASLVVP